MGGVASSDGERTFTLYSTSSTYYWQYKQPANGKPLTVFQTLVNWALERREEQYKQPPSSSDEEDAGEEGKEEKISEKQQNANPGAFILSPSASKETGVEEEQQNGGLLSSEAREHDDIRPSSKKRCKELASQSRKQKKQRQQTILLPRIKRVRKKSLGSFESTRSTRSGSTDSGSTTWSRQTNGNDWYPSEWNSSRNSLPRWINEVCIEAELWLWIENQCPKMRKFHWTLSFTECGMLQAGKSWTRHLEDSVDAQILATNLLLRASELNITGPLALFWHPQRLDAFSQLYAKTHISTYTTGVFPNALRLYTPDVNNVAMAVQVQAASEMFLEMARRENAFSYSDKLPDIVFDLWFVLDRRLLRRVLSSKAFAGRNIVLEGGAHQQTIAEVDCLLKHVRKIHWYNMNEALCTWLCDSLTKTTPEERVKELSCSPLNDEDQACQREFQTRIMTAALGKEVTLPVKWTKSTQQTTKE